ncbi:hypothetical protein GCM10009682_59600 [Luedemannella flava]|uniref:PPM-type phosphatase domain-containing protein n=1 Tax=Luedemannella flava TaxID=349316 RepID=A0ABN2MP19_9ACTN
MSGESTATSADRRAAIVQEILSVIPAGCTWLLPVTDEAGQVVDFRVAAASASGRDVYGRPGTQRVDAYLSRLYPSMVDGPLWQVYQKVLADGEPAELSDFRYREQRTGVVSEAQFTVSVQRVLDGLLVWWQRVDEDQRRLDRTETLGSLGWAEYDLIAGRSDWSPGMYRIFARDPDLGPASRAEQNAAILPEDRGLAEAAWQTMDSGATSDVTVRFALGGRVKYLRIISDVARDSDGTPLKVYAVVQDVTAREDSRTAIERLSETLRSREVTALAEHRLAGQLQNLIQPVPREPFALAGLQAIVSYLPAESATRVGGDWYHAETLADGRVILAVGDVAGHGLDAATGMAHLRFGLIAWLSAGMRHPGALLAQMNRLCVQLGVTGTAVIGVFDPRSGSLRWARAGHPAPLLARSGRADELGRVDGILLGADGDATYPVVSRRLRPDDVVLLYTDGLVERRDRWLVDDVRHTLATVAPDLVRLGDLLGYPSPDDDTCTLAVRVLSG